MTFDILDIVFLPVLLFLGVVTSWFDFKSGKIKNYWIVIGFFWGVGGYLVISVFNLFGTNDFLEPILKNSLFNQNWLVLIRYASLNSFCALILGYLFWYFNLWSAGDAKLFFVFSLLLPLKYYFQGYIPIFPSIVLLTNGFFCALVFLFISFLPQILKSLRIFFIFIIQLLLPFVVFPSLRKIKASFKEEAVKSAILFIKSNVSLLKIFLNTLLMLATVFLILRMVLVNFKDFQIVWLNLIVILGLIIFSKPLSGFVKKNNKIVIFLLILYFSYVIFFLPGGIKPIFSFLLNMTLMFFLLYVGITILPKIFIRRNNNQKMPFAVWLTLGTIITFLLKKSILFIFK